MAEIVRLTRGFIVCLRCGCRFHTVDRLESHWCNFCAQRKAA